MTLFFISGGLATIFSSKIENKIGANSSPVMVEHTAVGHEFYQLPSTIFSALATQKNASVMLAFAMGLHTVRLIRGELTFCHKLLRRFCRGGQNLAVLIALWDLSVSMPQSDSPYSCPSSSYVSKILLAFLLRYRKQTAFFEHTLQFGSIKLCECTIFFAGKCSHYTGCFTGSHQGGLYAE